MAGLLTIQEQSSTPASPSSGYINVFANSNNQLAYVTPSGSVVIPAQSGGATGAVNANGGQDACFNENDATATASYTIGQGAYISGCSVLTNVFTCAGSSFVQDELIHFAGSLPAGISLDTPYYVLSGGTSSTFTISTTAGGTQLTGITNGSGFQVGKIRNAVVAGTFTVATGIVITIPTGSTLVIV